ncbi:MAG TPA: PKD domain-containing protein [Anaerolineales bacterium]|nr:PKD domain-containing protein [Anaerolineales bacterium]
MKMKALHFAAVAALTVGSLALPASTFAQTGLTVEASADVACDAATFTLNVSGGGGTYDVTWNFGDGESLAEPGVAAFPHEVDHTYAVSGEFSWSVMATDVADPALAGLTNGVVTIGPSVELTSDVNPPILTLETGSATLNFTAAVTGGEAPYTYGWDLDGDGTADAGADTNSATASFVYSTPGTYQASVTVTDNCGLTATDTLTVVVFVDEEAEQACHPMAQRIAEAVDSLFPGQAQSLYSCEDIFNFFTGGLTGGQLGFGRMWHAYKLAQTIEELTWEEILGWHLDGTGWGLLVQLDRFAEALDEIDTRQLYEMVMAGEASVKDIRTALQAVMRYDAPFEDALARLAEGATPGELTRFYRTAGDLGVEAEALDALLESGLTLAEVNHAGRLAERFGGSLEDIAANHAAGLSWGEVNQALRAGEDLAAGEPLVSGQAHSSEKRNQIQAEQHLRLTTRLAERYGVTIEEVEALWTSCSGDWACVREALRNLQSPGGVAPRDEAAAMRIADRYGVSIDAVWAAYETCNGDWGCVRKQFHPTGRPNH